MEKPYGFPVKKTIGFFGASGDVKPLSKVTLTPGPRFLGIAEEKMTGTPCFNGLV
jgi:hypothetical protein